MGSNPTDINKGEFVGDRFSLIKHAKAFFRDKENIHFIKKGVISDTKEQINQLFSAQLLQQANDLKQKAQQKYHVDDLQTFVNDTLAEHAQFQAKSPKSTKKYQKLKLAIAKKKQQAEEVQQVLKQIELLTARANAIESDSTYKSFFDDIVILETEASLMHTFFSKRKKALSQAINNNHPQSEIDDLRAELDTVALPLFYYSQILDEYYQQYGAEELAKKHALMAAELQAYLTGKAHIRRDIHQSIIDNMINDAKEKSLQTINGLTKLGLWKDTISNINAERVYWAYCHFAVNQTILIGEQAHIVVKKTGDHVTKVLNQANPVLNAASVGFYGARLLIDIAMIAKHTFCANDDEAQLSSLQRFCREVDNRKVSILNNIINGITNFTTNYRYAGTPASAQISAAIMLIDVLFNIWQWRDEQEKHNKTKAHIQQSLESINSQIAASAPEALDGLLQQKALEEENLKELNRQWRIKEARLQLDTDSTIITIGSYLTASASNIALIAPTIAPVLTIAFASLGSVLAVYHIGKHNQMLGFITGTGLIATFMFCQPAGILLSAMIGMVTVAISMSNNEINALNTAKDDFYAYAAELLSLDINSPQDLKFLQGFSHQALQNHIKQTLKIEDEADPRLQKLSLLEKNIYSAKFNLIKAVAERTVVPLLIFFTFAVYWPVAVGMIVGYLGYKITNALFEYSAQKQTLLAQNEAETKLADDLHTLDNGESDALSHFGLFKGAAEHSVIHEIEADIPSPEADPKPTGSASS